MGSLVQLSGLLPELWSLRCQKWLIFVFSTDWNKKLVPIRAKYLRASKTSYLPLPENAMDCQILSYHYQDVNP